MKQRLLDLFCGAGGCTRGYQTAGFEVWGVDIFPQPRYIGDHFLQADALTLEPWFLAAFDAIHASPPCQRWTVMQRQCKNGHNHPDLITPIRPILKATGLPYVIENVETCDVLIDPVLLCGSMFDMDVRRHRLFETNWPLTTPDWPCRHKIWAPFRFAGTINGSGKRPGSSVVNPIASETTHERFAEAMGIDWLPANGRKRPTPELCESIPPRYTEFIGEQLAANVCVPSA